MDLQSIPHLLLARRDRDGARPARLVKRGDAWSTLSWRDHADNVCAAAAAMRELGVSPI